MKNHNGNKKKQKKRHLKIENLEPRILWNAVPAADMQAPETAPGGEQVEFEITLENEGTEAGRNPFVDVHLDSEITFDSASLEGTNVGGQTAVFDAAGQATHPITGEVINGTAGDTLVTFDLKDINSSFAPGESARLSVLATANNGLITGDTLDVASSFGFEDNTANDGNIEARSALQSETITVQDFSLTTKLSQNEFEVGDTGTSTINVIVSPNAGDFVSLQIRQVIPDGATLDLATLNVDFDNGTTGTLQNSQILQENGNDVLFLDFIDIENNAGQNTDAADISITYDFEVSGDINDVNTFNATLEADQILDFESISNNVVGNGSSQINFSNGNFTADVDIATNSNETVFELATDFSNDPGFQETVHFRVGRANDNNGDGIFGIATATFDFKDLNGNTIGLENLKASFLDLDGFGNNGDAEIIEIRGFLNGQEIVPEQVFKGDLLNELDINTYQSTDGAFIDFNPDVNIELFFSEVDQIVFVFQSNQNQLPRDSFIGNFKQSVVDVNAETSFKVVDRDLELDKELFLVNGGQEFDATDVANNPVDAGDLLRIRNTIDHADAQNTAVAIIDSFSDTIPNNTTIEGNITVLDGNGNVLATIDPADANLVTFNGTEFTLNFDQLDENVSEVGADEVRVIEYDVRIDDSIEVQEDLVTTATLIHDNKAPEQATEQTEVSTKLEIATTLTDENGDALGTVNIGDTIKVQTLIDSTEATYNDLVVTQILPVGLIPDTNGDGVVNANDFTISGIVDSDGDAAVPVVVFNENNGALTFTFPVGSIISGEDGFSANGEVEILYDLIVDADTLVDDDGVDDNIFNFDITTDATFTDNDGNTVDAVQDIDPVAIQLAAPVLLVDQIVEDANGNVIADNQGVVDNSQQIDAGDTLTIVNTITHDENNSIGAASLENFTDDLPNNDLVVVNNVTIELLDVNGDVVETVTLAAADAIDANGDIDIDLAAELNRSVLEQGEEVVVTYDVSVQDTVQVADDLLTSAEVTHDSTRNAQDANALTVPSVIEPVTTLTDENDQLITEAELGDTIRVNVDVNATEGTYPDLVITQVLPEGVTPDLDNVVIEGIVEEGQNGTKRNGSVRRR
ncbi:hypothetical protein [Candidatus Uabimicrobium sp. HlEnr_7]|uniref:hypothetical protein n=1 Tax=Candidatus Uabimicrobium helgolandensis TaxID=3095367 RepID=UPI0035587445